MTDQAESVATQMLKPGVEGHACAWSPVWRANANPVWPEAFRDALRATPDATTLENVQIEAGSVHLGVAVRDCVRIRADATRPITEVILPSVGGSHGMHH